MKAAVIGSIVQDFFVTLSTDQNTIQGKIDIDHINFCLGGGGANVAMSLAYQGYQVALGAKMGAEYCMDGIMTTLEKAGISCHHMGRTHKSPTGISLIFPSLGTDTTLYVYRGANHYLTRHDCAFLENGTYDLCYISALSGPASRLTPILARMAHCKKVSVFLNPSIYQITQGYQKLVHALSYTTVLMLNYREALSLYRQLCNTPAPSREIINAKLLSHFFKRIHGHGVALVIVTAGKKGVYISDGTYIYYYPSLVHQESIVCTVGAGDAFGSAFMGVYMETHSIVASIKAGLVNSASVMQYQGAQKGLLKKKALRKQSALLDDYLLKQYRLF